MNFKPQSAPSTREIFRASRGRDRLLNMTTGPVEISREVAEAQIAPLYTPHNDAFWSVHDETVGLLQSILKTRHLTLPMHGSIRSGLDVALANFIRPGVRVLVVENGYWGTLIGNWAQTYGADVTWVHSDPLAPVNIDQVRAALKGKRSFDLVTIVHVETNTGVVNPVSGLGKMVRESGALYFVDAACSAGAMPYETDAWCIDIGVTGSHKCLASAPGLAIVSLSDRAYETLKGYGESKIPLNYFNLCRWVNTTLERREVPPFTQPVSLILALRAALRDLEARGDERFSVNRNLASIFMSRVRSAGLRMVLDNGAARDDRNAYSDTVLAVTYPDGVSDADFRGMLLRDYGVLVIGNVGQYAGKSFRAGLMSPSQMESVNFYGALHAIEETARRTISLK